MSSTNNCGCGNSNPCIQTTPCSQPDCACAVLISSDCVNNVTEDLLCSNIKKGQTLTETLVQLDAFICDKFDSVSGAADLVNVGDGAEIYKGLSTLGKRQIRSLVGEGGITVTEGEDEITIASEPGTFKENIVVSLDNGKYLGKYASGETIPAKDKTFEWVIRDIAIEYLKPAVTEFLNTDVPQLLEVGVPIAGQKKFTWKFKDEDNVKPNSVDILNASDNTPLAGGTDISNTSPATLDIGTVVNTSPITKSWRLRATNTDSTPADFTTGSTGNAADYTIETIYPIFYGNSPTKAVPTGALVAGGTKALVKSNGTISADFNDTVGVYHWFAIPKVGSVDKTKWWNDSFDQGDIGKPSDYYGAYTEVQVTSPTGLWTGVTYRVSVSNQAAVAIKTEFRNN